MMENLQEMGQAYLYLTVVRNFTTSSLIHPTVDTRGDCVFFVVFTFTRYILIFYDMDCVIFCVCCLVLPLYYGLQRLNAFSTRHNTAPYRYIVLRMCMLQP